MLQSRELYFLTMIDLLAQYFEKAVFIFNIPPLYRALPVNSTQGFADQNPGVPTLTRDQTLHI